MMLYSVLSDEQKRKEYNQKLEQERELKRRQEEQEIINNVAKNYSETQRMEQNNNIVNNNSNVQNNTNYYKGNTQRNNQKAYTEKDYIRDYNRKLKKFRMQLIGRNVKENLKALAIMTLIILIIWFFPPIT